MRDMHVVKVRWQMTLDRTETNVTKTGGTKQACHLHIKTGLHQKHQPYD